MVIIYFLLFSQFPLFILSIDYIISIFYLPADLLTYCFSSIFNFAIIFFLLVDGSQFYDQTHFFPVIFFYNVISTFMVIYIYEYYFFLVSKLCMTLLQPHGL